MKNISELFVTPHFQGIKNKASGNFTKVPNSLINSEILTIFEKMVWIAIKRYKMTHETCWPSHDTISKKAGCGVSSVKLAIKGLEEKGWIMVEKKPNRKSNDYRIMNGSP